MSKKIKTLKLGNLKKNEWGRSIQLDQSITEVQVTRSYETKGETITEVVKFSKNDKGYLPFIQLNDVKENVNFRVDQGWLESDKGQQEIDRMGEWGVSHYAQVKVESK